LIKALPLLTSYLLSSVAKVHSGNVIALLAPHDDGKDDQPREARAADYRDTRHEQDPIDHWSAPTWDRVNSLLGRLDKPVR
jgi:hypothetical protein